MDTEHEQALRRKAIRMLRQGKSPSSILRVIPRSRAWLHKWWRRFLRDGWAGLKSRSRRPYHPSQRYGRPIRRLIKRARRELERARIGLIGPRTVRQKLKRWGVRPLPSESTIAREMRAVGLTHRYVQPNPQAYYPHPRPTTRFRLHAMDWTAHSLQGGQTVYTFNTVDYTTRDVHSRVYGDKSIATVCSYALDAWRGHLGLPDGLQIDNDAAFIGGYRGKRVFGRFVRLCLYLGIEPIFIPFYEAERNELIEHINSLWQKAFWKRSRFRSLAHVQRCNPEFERWYRHDYIPPALDHQTSARLARQHPVVRLTAAQARNIPSRLPITAGRVHFIRQVDAYGEIVILNEPWYVGRRLAGQYVWATIVTHEQRLDIYYRRSLSHPVQRLKTWRYVLSESVAELRPEFRRHARRRKMSTML